MPARGCGEIGSRDLWSSCIFCFGSEDSDKLGADAANASPIPSPATRMPLKALSEFECECLTSLLKNLGGGMEGEGDRTLVLSDDVKRKILVRF